MRVVKNIIFLYLAYFLTFLAGFLQLKILTLFIPKDALGHFFFAGNVGLFLGSILLLGFPLVFQRYIPIYRRDEMKDKEASLIYLAFSLHIAVGIILFIAVYYLKGISFLLPFSAFYLLSTYSIPLFAFISQEKAYYYAIYSSLRIGAVVVFLYLFRRILNIERAALVILVSTLTFMVPALLSSARPVFKFRMVFDEIKAFLKYSFFSQLLSPFFQYMDGILIPLFMPYSFLSIFTVARKLDFGSRQILEIPLQATAPYISSKKEDETREELFRKGFNIFRTVYFYAALTIFFIFLFFGRRLIVLVSSPSYLDAYPHLILLSLSLLISSIFAPDAMYSRSVGRVDIFFYKDVVWVFSFLLYIFVAAPHFKLYGFSSAFVFASLLTLIYQTSKLRTAPLVEYIYDILRVVLISVGAYVFYLRGNYFLPFLILMLIITVDFRKIMEVYNFYRKYYKRV